MCERGSPTIQDEARLMQLCHLAFRCDATAEQEKRDPFAGRPQHSPETRYHSVRHCSSKIWHEVVLQYSALTEQYS